jgi:putative ABC transport system permease protein
VRALNFRMPLRFLRGSYSRLALTVIALACGVGLVCAIDLVNRAVLRAFVEVIDTMAGRAALQVSAGEGGLFPEEVAATVAAVPGVELAVPVVSATAFTADESGELLTVHGVDITNEAAVRVYEGSEGSGPGLQDPLTFLNDPGAVMLTHEFSSRKGLTVGDSIDIETPTGRRRFTIRALLAPKGIARVHGGNLAIMDLYAAEAAFARPGFVNRVDVVVKREYNVAHVREGIGAILPAGLEVKQPVQRKADLHKVMQSIQAVLQAVALLGLMAAFLIAFNRLATVFDQRTWQLAVIRAAGVRTRVVWRELVKESLFLGTCGVGLGILLGVGLARLLLPLIATTTALSSKLIMPATEVTVQLSSLGVAVALGLGSAVLAALIPARRAARVAIARALQSRGAEQPKASGRSIWVARVVCWLGAAIAVFMHLVRGTPEWGLVASAGIVIAVALTARPLLDVLSSPTLAALNPLGNPTGRFALATLGRNPRRAALTIATLGVGFGAVLWLWVLAQSFERSVVNTMPGVLRGDLAVSSTHVGTGFVEAPIDDAVLDELRAVDGVDAVVGNQATDWQYGGGPIAINAFDPAYFTDPRFREWPLIGPRLPDVWEAVNRGEAVLISTNFALHLDAHVGDEIALDTPRGLVRLRVAGMMADFLSPRGTLAISREVYKRQWNDSHIVHALVRTAPGADIAAVRVAIAGALGHKYSLKILSLDETVEWFVTQVRKAFSAVYLLAGMVMVVVLVGVADTLAASVFERTRELGVLRAAGLARRRVRRVILTEGLALAALGLLLAGAGGLALGVLWVKATFPYMLGWVLELHIPYAQLALLAATAIAVCAGAALLPANRAAHLDPAAALRYE